MTRSDLPLSPDGSPRLIHLRQVATQMRTAWPIVYARYKGGTLPFPVISVNAQLWVERAEWDAYCARILADVEAYERDQDAREARAAA